MNKLTKNYHSHTYRCGHAEDFKDEEYVEAAIKNNFKIMGFSDHAPFPNIIHHHMRMDFNEFDDYLNSVNFLKEKYKDKITIYKGLEIEYLKEYNDYYKELLNKYKLNYLILGQHLTYDSDGNPEFYFRGPKNNEIQITRYKNDLIEGMKTGYFSYVCHPDLFLINCTFFNDFTKEISLEICKAAKELNIPLEININGFYEEREYPSVDFFKIAKEIGNTFIFGIDAHSPDRYEKIPYEGLELFLKNTGIEEKDIIDEIKIINC